jgi:F-type H+-transporting ATPase subunit epsilon
VADDEHKLHAEVLTPEGRVFDGEVVQLSTRTVVGEIGILANHAPLVARLVPAELRLHVSESETRRWAQAEGWLEVLDNKATVLIGEAIPPDGLDASELKQRIADAEQRLGEAEEGSATYQEAERDKARAERFLEVAENR